MKQISILLNKFFSSRWLLIAILVLAVGLRLFKLGSIPPGLTPDEASLGYNTYSIGKTGKDEYGKTLPIIFKSFGDFKPGLYVYLTIPSVAILGLNEFSTRLPSAIFGVLSVYLIYLIVRKLFKDRTLAIVAMTIAAINPYLILFSRGAWEANVALTLTLAGIFFFLKSLEKNKYLLLSSVFFALTFIAYQGAKLSTAIVLILLVCVYWKDFWKIKIKYLLISLGLGILISTPIFLSLFNGQTQRLTIFSIFSYPRPQSEIQTYSDGYFGLFHSNQLNYARMVMSRWFNFYSGDFLVFEGDLANPVSTPPYQGVLLLMDLIMMPFGLFYLFKNKSSKGSLFIVLWLLLAPFSAAISRDETNAVRSLNVGFPMVAVISFGIFGIIRWLGSRKIKWLGIFIFVVFYLLSFAYFLDANFIHLSAHNSDHWRYGYREAVRYVTSIQSKYKNVIFEQSFNQPYIYFLFYQKYNPSEFQKQARLVDSEYKGDVGYQMSLDNILFEKIDWSVLRNTKNTLVVVDPARVPVEIQNDKENFPVIKEIKYLNGRDVAFEIIEIK